MFSIVIYKDYKVLAKFYTALVDTKTILDWYSFNYNIERKDLTLGTLSRVFAHGFTYKDNYT